jgi:predicted NBD/HSP70 family sugar kinase
MGVRAVCIEVGGGGVQTAVFDGVPEPSFYDGARSVEGAPLLIAVPGIIEDGRVLAAANLDWYDVDPVRALGLRGHASVVCNDAEAAALGESVLRGGADLAYLGLGTGIGGAIVRGGEVVAREVFGHRGGFGDAPCPCGRTGCLETVAAGWALPDPLPPERFEPVADALARAVSGVSVPELVVAGGGLARAYPELVALVRARLPKNRVEATAAPAVAKSAAAWGLLRVAGL